MMSVLHDVRREPPGFGDGKQWLVRVVDWECPDQPDQSGMMFVPRGMPVKPEMHEHYFEIESHARKVFAGHAAAGAARPDVLVLLDRERNVVGYSPLDADDGAAEVAFLSCAFAELGFNTAMALADAVRPEEHGLPADSIGKVSPKMKLQSQAERLLQ